MDPIEFHNIAVFPFDVPNFVGWRFQVSVGAGPLPIMGTSPRARLGAQVLEGIQVSPDGTGFGGYLKDPPADGDTLFFNFPGFEERDTGLKFRQPQ